MTSKSTKKQAATNLSCEFCKRRFSKESTLVTHICEPKRRWQDKDKKGNIIGLNAWLQFYTKHGTKKKKDYGDFVKSAYYTAFVKFGNYCADAGVLQINRYVDWLLKNQIGIDNWNRDTHYTKFVIDYCKSEDPLDAIARSIETTVILAQDDKLLTKDVLRFGNRNKICYEITKGKISPWMLFHSESGMQFIESLDSTQQKMIFEYINPEQWALKFNKHKNIIPEIKELLRAGGY